MDQFHGNRRSTEFLTKLEKGIWGEHAGSDANSFSFFSKSIHSDGPGTSSTQSPRSKTQEPIGRRVHMRSYSHEYTRKKSSLSPPHMGGFTQSTNRNVSVRRVETSEFTPKYFQSNPIGMNRNLNSRSLDSGADLWSQPSPPTHSSPSMFSSFPKSQERSVFTPQQSYFSQTGSYSPQSNSTMKLGRAFSDSQIQQTQSTTHTYRPTRYTVPSAPNNTGSQSRGMSFQSKSVPVSPSGSPPKVVFKHKKDKKRSRSANSSPRKKRPHDKVSHGPGKWPDGVVNQVFTNQQKPKQRSSDETQDAKAKFKEFQKSLKEIKTYEAANSYCEEHLPSLPQSIHWRVYMELAEFAKRENKTKEAQNWYKQVNVLQPTAAQGWLEHAKLEEDSANMIKCELLLRKGLEHCQFNEALIGKAVKYFESMNQLDDARSILGRLVKVNVEKSWKLVLEGALLESRDGRIETARALFKFLIRNVGRHGPIYYEAYRLEEKWEEDQRALEIVERGLEANPRYGPLWFSAFHLLEKEAMKTKDYSKIRTKVEEAVMHISKELIWKVYYEAGKIEERAGNYQEATAMYAKSVMDCLPNLLWKIWVAGARTELMAGKPNLARGLLNRALEEVPNKTRAVVLIECSRLEEYVGNLDKARTFLSRAKDEAKHEWKVFLESILLEMRAGNISKAMEEANEALKIHRGTGRLWAVLIQLKQEEGEEAQIKELERALEVVPKSGEVWCEGARIVLNPLSKKFNLTKARKYLNFAIKFTPQYGDSFIEYLRLELLNKGPRLGEHDKQYLEQLCVNADPNYGPLWFHCKKTPLDSTRQVLRRAKTLLIAELRRFQKPYQKAIINSIFGTHEALPETDQYQRKDFVTGLHGIEKAIANDPKLRRKVIFGIPGQ